MQELSPNPYIIGEYLKMRRFVIGVVGDARIGERSRKHKLAISLGRSLIDKNYRIVTGGVGDLPYAISLGARSSSNYHDGDLIGILPGFDPSVAEDYCDITIATGMDQARNMIIANCDAVVAIGGGAGTLSEIAYAWSLKRLILSYRIDGWSKKLADKRIDSRVRYKEIVRDRIYPVDSSEDVIRLLAKWLPKYTRRHREVKVRARRLN